MHRKTIGLILGPLLFGLIIGLSDPHGLSESGIYVAAVAALMATWWISEAVPIPATALLPIALFPLLGVMETQSVTTAYANHLVYLFMGGFLIAVTVEKWNLHKRIALHTILLIGTSTNRIILGFMIATGVLSMWLSNTATAMMMVTIGLAVIKQTQAMVQTNDTQENSTMSFGTVLMLSIAYAASIGGVATLIGTPPNAILVGVLESNYGIQIGFGQWMLFGVPLSIIMLLFTWIYLTRFCYRGTSKEIPGGRIFMRQQLQELGSISKPEKRVLFVFICVAIAWLLRGVIEIDALSLVTDSSIAICGALALFLIPSSSVKGENLLDWNTAKNIPWDVIILFGGGFALAQGFADSGLTLWLAHQLAFVEGMHVVILIALIVLLVIFLTEVTSNTATASILLPVMGAVAIAMGIHPAATMIAVAVAASYAFMLPVATPPNAIVFVSRVVSIPQMVKVGIILNLFSVILITVFILYVLPASIGFDVRHATEIISQ